jgi:hypothetical protein
MASREPLDKLDETLLFERHRIDDEVRGEGQGPWQRRWFGEASGGLVGQLESRRAPGEKEGGAETECGVELRGAIVVRFSQSSEVSRYLL